jgi:hypothetical protein
VTKEMTAILKPQQASHLIHKVKMKKKKKKKKKKITLPNDIYGTGEG